MNFVWIKNKIYIINEKIVRSAVFLNRPNMFWSNFVKNAIFKNARFYNLFVTPTVHVAAKYVFLTTYLGWALRVSLDWTAAPELDPDPDPGVGGPSPVSVLFAAAAAASDSLFLWTVLFLRPLGFFLFFFAWIAKTRKNQI
jgi:hypothetical protein